MHRQSRRPVVVVVAWLASMAPCLVFAQPGGGGFRGGGGFGGPAGGGGGGVLGLVTREEVQEELQLVDEQRDKVVEAVEDMRNQMRDEMRDIFSQMRDLSDEERQERFDEVRSRMQTINADMEKQLKKVLLPQQYDRLKQIELQSRIQFGGAAALTSGDLAETLNLTDDQREKLERRAAEVEKELQEQIRQLRIDARNKMLDVLTSEQRAKFDSLVGDQFQLSQPTFGFGGFGGRGGPGGRGGGGFGGGRGGDGGNGGGGNRRPDR